MKISTCFLILLMVVACSGVKTRKEAAEEAKVKAATAENNPAALGPIDEESDEPSYTGASGPSEDQVLNDELAAMGIDPTNPDKRKSETPEPEVHGNPVPAPETVPPPPVRKAAPAKVATKAKKPTTKKSKKPDAKKKKKKSVGQ